VLLPLLLLPSPFRLLPAGADSLLPLGRGLTGSAGRNLIFMFAAAHDTNTTPAHASTSSVVALPPHTAQRHVRRYTGIQDRSQEGMELRLRNAHLHADRSAHLQR
jgi:hypothetical protein